jgi:hypothetical protein
LRIGKRDQSAPEKDKPPPGPWSDLPPSAPPPRPASRPAGRRPAREPIIRNWRGLLIVLFLLLVAPLVARWASAVILGLLPGH